MSLENNANLEPNLLLDSKLIVTTTIKQYDIKLVECGDYIQTYIYANKRIKNNKNDNDLELKKIKIDNNNIENNKNEYSLKTINEIDKKNIIRSKLECQRLAKSNMKDWKTFITLTFDPKTTNISLDNIYHTNKRFRYFIDKIQRVKKDFKYICVPEFHKSGLVHYHLLCNIDINDDLLMYTQEDNSKFRHIKYWIDGFTSVEPITGDAKKVVGYISKYMTKDIDNRLFNRHRYFYSRNLVKPYESFINLDEKKDKEFYIKKIQNKDLIYQNDYINSYDNSLVTFIEFYPNTSNILPHKDLN